MDEGGPVMTSTVGEDGAVVIPAELRERFGLGEWTEVVAEAREDGSLSNPWRRPAAATTGRLLEETNRA